MTTIPKEDEQEWYSTLELAEADWFPIRSTDGVREQIQAENLDAKDICSIEGQTRWRVTKDSVIEFMQTDNE